MKEFDIASFKVNDVINLDDCHTKFDLSIEEKSIEKELRKVRKKLGKLQDTLYAHGKYAVLICIQGMDTAGKDSMIREVFKDFNSRGVVVHSFKVPTPLELGHDYLWRHYIALPAKGKFGIFNRTHYENVLVTRVHPGYIMGENIPGINSVADITQNFWDQRFDQINNFEDEQKSRLLRRLDKPEKNWKFSPGDLKERKLWDQYKACYQEAINKTSKPHAPWFTIPADDKATARYLVAKILYDTLKTYSDIREPDLDEAVKANLEAYKKQLNEE